MGSATVFARLCPADLLSQCANVEKKTVPLSAFNLFKLIDMKRRLLQLATTYALFVLIFILQKPFFMVYYHSIYKDATVADYFSVIWHGLPLDLSLAGYLTIIPALLIIVTAWTKSGIIKSIRRGYFLLVSILLSCIFIADLGLYAYWGFRLDSTPLFYLLSSPKDALASVSLGVILSGVIAMLAYGALLYVACLLVLVRQKKELKVPYKRITVSAGLLLATALLFIPIRGGFTVSTMNLSKVYYSTNLQLNHAAINPCFSLMESFTRQTDFDKQYRFFSAEQANTLFDTLKEQPATDSIPQLFTTNRPNIILVILESFSSKLMTTLGGEPHVATNLDTLTKEGVLFTHFYANSFRTDRGLAAIISGYPAQPTTSIMKYPKKTQSLPSIPGSLKRAGYQLQYYYGGDADFTNMRSYLISAGIDQIVSDKDFPLSQRLSKWGAHDEVVFNRLLADLAKSPQQAPFFKILQTSSSHEPFEVPFQRLNNKILNAFAYTDSCAGNFIERLKRTKEWNNTVVIFVPDHLGAYPEGIDNLSFGRYEIPLLFVGGAIKEPQQIATYGSQIDIAATLLAQLGLPHDEFAFSKNMLNPASPHFGYFTFPNAFGMITPQNQVVFNCESNTPVSDEGTHKGENLNKGKALLQKLYDDLAKR